MTKYIEKKIKREKGLLNAKKKKNLSILLKDIRRRYLQIEITPLRKGFPEGPASSAWPDPSVCSEATPTGLLAGSSRAVVLLARYL